jgi:hypothetical protein
MWDTNLIHYTQGILSLVLNVMYEVCFWCYSKDLAWNPAISHRFSAATTKYTYLQQRAVKLHRSFINISLNLSPGTYRLTTSVVNNKQHLTLPTWPLHPPKYSSSFKPVISGEFVYCGLRSGERMEKEGGESLRMKCDENLRPVEAIRKEVKWIVETNIQRRLHCM